MAKYLQIWVWFGIQTTFCACACACAFQKHSENIKAHETCLVHIDISSYETKVHQKININICLYCSSVIGKKVVIAIIIGPWDVDVQKICFVAYLERISFELFSSFSNLAYEPNYHL
jgi:hypothetical protein